MKHFTLTSLYTQLAISECIDEGTLSDEWGYIEDEFACVGTDRDQFEYAKEEFKQLSGKEKRVVKAKIKELQELGLNESETDLKFYSSYRNIRRNQEAPKTKSIVLQETTEEEETVTLNGNSDSINLMDEYGKSLKCDLFAIPETIHRAMSQAYDLIGTLQGPDKTTAFTALHTCLNAVSEDIIRFNKLTQERM